MSCERQAALAFAFVMATIPASAPCTCAQENAYHVVEGWPTLPSNIMERRNLGRFRFQRDWFFHRSQPLILELDPAGKMIKSFGTDMIRPATGA
jgi:hypothetical protein